MGSPVSGIANPSSVDSCQECCELEEKSRYFQWIKDRKTPPHQLQWKRKAFYLHLHLYLYLYLSRTRRAKAEAMQLPEKLV